MDNEDIHENEVQDKRNWKWEEQFPAALKNIIHKCIRRTEKYKKHFLNFLLAYSGDDEMVEATNSLLAKCKGKVKRITAKMIKEHLMTRDLPPVDLLVRNRRRAAQQRRFHDVGCGQCPAVFFRSALAGFRREKNARSDFGLREKRKKIWGIDF